MTDEQDIVALEDAIDCAGAAREDDEIVAVRVGAIRTSLDLIERLRREVEEAAALLDRWDYSRSEMSGAGTIEGETRAWLKARHSLAKEASHD